VLEALVGAAQVVILMPQELTEQQIQVAVVEGEVTITSPQQELEELAVLEL
jgi:hypothetical protein